MTKRARKNKARGNGAAASLLKGLLCAIGVTAGCVAVLALLIALTDMGETPVRVLSQLIKLLAIFVGVRLSVPRGEARGAMRGAALGLIYMGAGLVVYALGTRQQLTLPACLMDGCMGVAAGGLMGMLRASRPANTAKV